MTEQFIGNYKVIEQRGAGGMARVYLAVHKSVPNLKVILKILMDPRMIERFLEEANKLALLEDCPSICQIKDFFEWKNDYVIVMEFIDGITLEDELKNKGKLPVEQAIRITTDMLLALEFAHQKGIFHRDIKPANIMLEPNGKVRVIDFGIAKGESDKALTTVGAPCGTADYMAPEQFTPSADTKYALVDIYATGTTLFELVTGQLPFKGDNEFVIRDAKCFDDPPKARDLNPKVPNKLENIIQKAINRTPEKRFTTVGEMITALGDISSSKKLTQPVKKNNEPNQKKILIFGGSVIVVGLIIWSLMTMVFTDNDNSQVAESIQDSTIVTTPVDTLNSQESKDTSSDTISFTDQLEPATGLLQLTSNMKASFWINDSLIVSSTTFNEQNLPPGNYHIVAKSESTLERTIDTTIMIIASDTITFNFLFSPKPTPLKPAVKPKKIIHDLLVTARYDGNFVRAKVYWHENSVGDFDSTEFTAFTINRPTGNYLIKVAYKDLILRDTINLTKSGTTTFILDSSTVRFESR